MITINHQEKDPGLYQQKRDDRSFTYTYPSYRSSYKTYDPTLPSLADMMLKKMAEERDERKVNSDSPNLADVSKESIEKTDEQDPINIKVSNDWAKHLEDILYDKHPKYNNAEKYAEGEPVLDPFDGSEPDNDLADEPEEDIAVDWKESKPSYKSREAETDVLRQQRIEKQQFLEGIDIMKRRPRK